MKHYSIIKNVKISLFTTIIFLFFSCTDTNKKKSDAHNDSTANYPDTPSDNPASYDSQLFRTNQKPVKFKYSDFEKFYDRFIIDSIFQLSHVQFPLKGQYEDYENSKKWTKSAWPLIKWDVRDLKNPEDSTSLIETPVRFFFGTYCLDCGFSFEMEFQKKEDDWFLIYRQENNY